MLRPRLLAFILTALATPVVHAQTATVTYDLVNVMLLPNISHPWATNASPLTGSFVWTYTIGDFENGTGTMVNYSIPYWGGGATVVPQVEVDSLQFTMLGNYHNLGLDVEVKTLTDLDPWLPSTVDTINSSFDIEYFGQYKGTMISGSIVPRCPTTEAYGTGTAGTGGFMPALTSINEPSLGNSNFAITGTQLLGGTACVGVIASQDAQLPVLGVTLLVDPATAVTSLITATGTPGVAGAGTMQLPIAIPNVPALVGADFYTQVLAFDTGAAGGMLSASNGVSLFVCN